MAKTQHWTLGIWDVTNKATFWRELANKINADFKILTTVSRDLNRLKLTFVYDNVQVKFSESDTKPLFIECLFESPTGQGWFEISKSDFVDKLLNYTSKHKLKPGNKQFGKNYIIKGRNDQKINAIINNPKIIATILEQNINFIGGRQDKKGKYKLEINVNRNVNNLEQLTKIYQLTLSLIDILNGKA